MLLTYGCIGISRAHKTSFSQRYVRSINAYRLHSYDQPYFIFVEVKLSFSAGSVYTSSY